jgi:hypothetical protein
MDASGPLQEQYFAKDISLDGIAHLAGNIREWAQDVREGSAAVTGGSWRMFNPNSFSTQGLAWANTSSDANDLGFRIVVIN